MSCSCPPPPASSPPPIIPTLFVVIFLASLIIIAGVFGRPRLVFCVQMALFTASIYIVPTVVHRLTQGQGRLAKILLETTLFMSLLIAFSLWLFGRDGLGFWIAYAVGLILVLEAGSNLMERYMLMTVERVSRTESLSCLQSDAEAAEKMFRGELVLYISVPLGLTFGTIVGLIANWTIQITVVFSVQIVLALASLVLIGFLIGAFVRMSDSQFKEAKVTSPRIEKAGETEGILRKLGKALRFLVPPLESSNKQDQEQRDLYLAYVITDLRKLYLYDSLHNIILVVSFAAIILKFRNIGVDTKWILATLIGLGFILGQLPYIIGQSLLHEKILDRYEGMQRADLVHKLKKNAPLFPTIDFMAALFTTGTAGSVVYYLLDQIVKDTLK